MDVQLPAAWPRPPAAPGWVCMGPDWKDRVTSMLSFTLGPKGAPEGPMNFSVGSLSISKSQAGSARFKGNMPETVNFSKSQTVC